MVRESPQGERREVTNELLTLTAQKLDKCSQKGRDLAMIFKVVLAGFWKLLKVEKSKRNLQQEEECFPKDKGWCFNCDREVLTEECVKTCALRLQKHVDDVHAIRHSIRQHEAKGWLEEIPLREAVDELEGVPAPAGLKFYYDEGGQKRPLSNNFFLAGSVGGEKKDRRLILSHKDFTNKILGLGNLVESDWLKATLKALRPDEGVADFIHNLFF